MIDKTFGKTIGHAGNVWIRMEPSIRWEIENGRSSKFGPRFSIGDNCLSDYLTTESLEQSVVHDNVTCEKILETRLSLDDSVHNELTKKTRTELLIWFSADQCSEEWNQSISDTTREWLSEWGEKNKYNVAENLKPDRDWLSFGFTRTMKVLQFLAAWKYRQRGKLDVTKKLVNFTFDMRYITYMAIADGLLSSDKEQLNIAWSIWPEKRENIFVIIRQRMRRRCLSPNGSLEGIADLCCHSPYVNSFF